MLCRITCGVLPCGSSHCTVATGHQTSCIAITVHETTAQSASRHCGAKGHHGWGYLARHPTVVWIVRTAHIYVYTRHGALVDMVPTHQGSMCPPSLRPAHPPWASQQSPATSTHPITANMHCDLHCNTALAVHRRLHGQQFVGVILGEVTNAAGPAPCRCRHISCHAYAVQGHAGATRNQRTVMQPSSSIFIRPKSEARS